MKTIFQKALCCTYLLLAAFVLEEVAALPLMTTEICYNGRDDNGDGLIDEADPLCKTIRVTTTADLLDGDISSVYNLMNNKGADGAISLREAIIATQSPTNRDVFHTIGFNFPNFDLGHFYYQDDNTANQVTEANRIRTTAIDDSTIGDKDVDYPRSWFQFTLNSSLPPLSDNVLIDGYDLRQTQMNENELGTTLNTVIRIEIVATGDFPIFTIEEARSIDNPIIIRGLSLNASHEIIQITAGTNGKIWLYGNYFGLTPTALSQQIAQKNLIDIQQTNRPIIIGSDLDGQNDVGELNLFNKFSHNIISFYETAFDLFEAELDTIANNSIGVYAENFNSSVISNEGGISSRCQALNITENTIANSQRGWHFLATKNSLFTQNEVYQNLTVGLNIVDETIDNNQRNEANFIYQNKIHHNLIGVLIGQNAAENTLLQNSIYANTSIGIDLSAAGINADGITVNDLNDIDVGVNQLLNFPELKVTNYTNVAVTIAVDLDIEDNFANQKGYRIEFFANSSPTDRGGEIYLGYLDVAGDVNKAEVTLPLPIGVLSNYTISATTSIIKIPAFTNLVPELAFSVTSEFSASVPLPPAEICDNNIDDDGDGLIDCADPDCGNYSTAGIIGNDEFSCTIFDPLKIESEVTPHTDVRETVFYQWQQKDSEDSDWEAITGATRATYDPTQTNKTIFYRRLVKKHLCNDWLISNVIEKKVKVIDNVEITTDPAPLTLCSGVPYVFDAADSGPGATYIWDFGPMATESLVYGKGPHTVIFDGSSGNRILLEVQQEGCFRTAFTGHNIRSLIQVNDVSTTQPTICGGADGVIAVEVTGELNRDMALSIDGGLTYLPDNQFTVNDLPAGAYHLFVRYCDIGCAVDGGIINLSDPAAIQVNDDAVSGFCPGVLFQGNVADNDTLGDNPVFSLAADANFGRVRLEQDGRFTYTPITNACGLDQFSYQVCNGNTGCCATAVVDITFGDEIAPTFSNLPIDITLGLDDEMTIPAQVFATDNCPTVDLKLEEISTQNNSNCGQYDYLLTRTWTATDQCGNSISHAQTINVVDKTAPDIFRIHTLPNGKKMVAGVMEFTSEHWKTIHLPFNFADNPIIFTQLVTNNEATAATVRLRNVTQNQFEIRLQEAEIDDGVHAKESVAWMAMESGEQTENYHWQADTIPVNHTWATVAFNQSFANIPLFFANMQTTRDADAGTVRNNSVNWNNGKIRIQEERSVDLNLVHNTETVGYLAIDNTDNLHNQVGETFGETGRIKTTNEWTTVTLSNTYYNPVVIANSLSIDDFDPATVRIQNVTANSFQVKVEEWSYLDGEHQAETIGYLVVEGSLPLAEPTDFCNASSMQNDFLTELIALDNTGELLPINYEERISFTGTEQLIHRDWSATDLCGNIGIVTQTIACPGIALKAKTMLQGALIGSNDPTLMRDDLRKANLIPLIEPYTDLAAYEHVGASGGETLKEDLLNIEGPDAIVDWVFLELRSRLNRNHVSATAVGLVQRDGDIVSNKGDALIVFPSAIPSTYYVAIRHRNHVCMISNSTQVFTNDNVPELDFTNIETIGGINSGVDVDTKVAMWAGDLNQDNAVIYQGPKNDVFAMFLAVLTDPANTNFISNFVSRTYDSADFNLDGKVIFQGPQNDRSALLFNTTLVHPENEVYLSNFILQITGKGGG